MTRNAFLIAGVIFIISLPSIPSYGNEVTPSRSEGANGVKSLSVNSVEDKETNAPLSANNSDSVKRTDEKKNDRSSPVNAQSANVITTSSLSKSSGGSRGNSEDFFEKKYQDYVKKIDSLLEIAEANIDTLDKKLESIYIADKKIGGVDGPGYYYRFKNESDSIFLRKGLYYVYTKKGNSNAGLVKGMLVNFSLSEKRPSGKTISQATNISLAYNDDLPFIAKLVFSVAKPGDSIKLVTLAEYIYPTKELLPSGVSPDDTLIYTFDINRQYEK